MGNGLSFRATLTPSEIGIATLELLERLGHEVAYPYQTCCSQPMANSGCNAECADTDIFCTQFFRLHCLRRRYVHHVRDNFDAVEQTAAMKSF